MIGDRGNILESELSPKVLGTHVPGTADTRTEAGREAHGTRIQNSSLNFTM
jgi:hypothetical protein